MIGLYLNRKVQGSFARRRREKIRTFGIMHHHCGKDLFQTGYKYVYVSFGLTYWLLPEIRYGGTEKVYVPH
jgi:hypothetical protein